MDGFGGDFDSSTFNAAPNPAPESVVAVPLQEANHRLGLAECGGGNFSFWSNLFHNTSNQNEQQPSPSRLDSEWGYVLQNKDKNKRILKDVGGSSTGVSSCSDLSEALTAISADLSLSSSSSGERENMEKINPPTLPHLGSSQNNGNQIQVESCFGEKGKTHEAKFVFPAVGMEFSSEDEVYEFYKTYAEATGFRVRKGKVRRSQSDRSITKRYFLCSRQGRKEDKQTTYKKKDTRTGCNARIECKLENGKWKIYQFFDRHNHPIESAKISEIHVANREGKIPTLAVGTKSVEFDVLKMHACDEKVDDMKTEVQHLINYFNQLQRTDPSIFSAIQRVDGKAKSFFWMDWCSKLDYKYFGDVLILNATFKLDKYGIICSPFLGLNHHRQFVLFGCAFLLDETIHSLVWLLQTFLQAMDSVQPKSVLTNESSILADAIKEVFPAARHQIGLWHIRQNLASLFECQTEEEFCSWWIFLLEGFDGHGNPWLSTLYQSRERWAPLFDKKTFTAGIQDTSGIDGSFQSLTRKAKTLSLLVAEYLILASQQRKKESLADNLCKEKEREFLLDNNVFEQQAADVYTCTMFNMFQKELVESDRLEIEAIGGNETAAKFKLKDGHRKYSIVEFNCLDSTAVCSCSKYESLGILCSHILRVLTERNMFRISPRYILKRWTKSAKEDHVVLNNMMWPIILQMK